MCAFDSAVVYIRVWPPEFILSNMRYNLVLEVPYTSASPASPNIKSAEFSLVDNLEISI